MESNTMDETIQHATKPESKDETSQHSKAQSMDETSQSAKAQSMDETSQSSKAQSMDETSQSSKARSLDKMSQSSKVENLKPQEMLPNQKLPYELLLMLFSYLSILDLVSVRRVCSGWRAAALDKSLWKKLTLTLHRTPEDERQIKMIPELRNISGNANNSFINIILENITDLDKLNVKFDPPLSLLQVKAVIEKYPTLGSISLNVRAPDLLNCLELLKTSKHLMEILFNIDSFYDHLLWKTRVSRQIFDVMNNCKNFPAIREIISPGISNFISGMSD